MMHKKLILALCLSSFVMLGTGCTNSESLSKTALIKGTNQKYITYDYKEWNRLLTEVEDLDIAYEGRVVGVNHYWPEDEIHSSTYTGENESCISIYNVDHAIGKKALNLVVGQLGEKVNEFVQETRGLTEAQGTKMNTYKEEFLVHTGEVDDYKLVGTKGKDSIGLYIMKEPFKFRNQVDEAFVSQFKTDKFLLKAYSQGAKESMIELTTPSYTMRMNGTDLYNTTSYYQLFRNNENKLTKARMLINVYNQNPIDQEEFIPLEKIIAYLGGQPDLVEQVKEEVNQIITNDDQGKVMGSGSIKCTIRKRDAFGGANERLIEVLVE